ncbi:hypothetical protein RND71_035621 [Anisodus tanguticus]|uniref:Uncharacterized protein n=1 Tax=Anisodus tanguticus TaxID=243964 RepID=A0AAE1V2C5_9SOLA|nr:hypothetical protein RND71_035621 [Anisodus tanguticus]
MNKQSTMSTKQIMGNKKDEGNKGKAILHEKERDVSQNKPDPPIEKEAMTEKEQEINSRLWK